MMNSYLNDKKRQKLLKQTYSKAKKEKKKRLKFIDKLFIRIFFSSICLLILTAISTFSPNKNDTIKTYLNDNFNFLNISQNINTLFGSNLLNSGTINVYSQTFYETVKYENEVNYVSNSSFAGVEALVDGVVIKIEKTNNNYTIHVQASDGIIYEYSNLESIDVNIYEYIAQKEVIAKAKYIDNQFTFELKIRKNNQYYSYYENCEN